MKTGLDAYRDQINVWMETICEKTFDDPRSRNDPESKKRRGQVCWKYVNPRNFLSHRLLTVLSSSFTLILSFPVRNRIILSFTLSAAFRFPQKIILYKHLDIYNGPHYNITHDKNV